ncbi:hypothetical protein DTO195F2_3138 [Paecilomyces variotii]|nr:hypothetical protein DTO195F2_3138 [Paecilomyces variotii]KAJ9373706.1 hypothetical protein DTO282E5_1490 [Paecilomyces variotii]
MTTPDAFRDAEYIADVSSVPNESDGPDHGLISQQAYAARHEATKKAQATAKVAFIDRLLRDLDIMIYCELSALYYMDCSIILFAVRAIVQLIFFTPKAPPFEPTRNQPFVGAIFISNLFCILVHLLSARPEAGESTRGYLHGGLFIDFIGQKGPVYKLRLVAFDFLVIALHILMLGLILERVKTASKRATQRQPRRSQDHDAEERGVLRRDDVEDPAESPAESPNDYEPSPGGTRYGTADSPERAQLLADPAEGPYSEQLKDNHPLDGFMSGEAVIMDMSVFSTILDQWRYTPALMYARASGYAPYTESTRFLGERFGLEVGPDGRVARVYG